MVSTPRHNAGWLASRFLAGRRELVPLASQASCRHRGRVATSNRADLRCPPHTQFGARLDESRRRTGLGVQVAKNGEVGVQLRQVGDPADVRRLVPNVVDRVAQSVAVAVLEPNVEKVFHDDSYGYRPGRSPLDAVKVCRERCWKRDWIVDLDVKAFFDSVPWDLMLKALERHTDQKWVLLYVERWLKAPMLMPDGTLLTRTKGTPQGGPVSPLIANIFLHHGLDSWIHCVTERQSREVREAVGRRFADIGLELHPDKTRIVYCKDGRRRLDYARVSFTFCGYAFRPRRAYDKKRQECFTRFLPAVAPEKLTDMSRKVASWRLHRRTNSTLDDLAREVNPALRGWLTYFTAFYISAVIPLATRTDRHLMRWARRKYKRLERSNRRAYAWLKGVRQRSPALFAHWALRY